jgi:ATP-dependent Lon protease
MKRREPSQNMHTLPLFRCEGRVALPHSVLSIRVEDPKEISVIENMMRSTSFSRDIGAV